MNKKEKKLKTVSTSVKEENVEITQVTANGNVVIHPVTKAQNVKYKNSNLNDVLENKIALDGDGGQNFNFIENKVVQDGLVFAELGKVNTPVDVVKKNISVCMILNLSTSESSYVNHGLFPTANFFTYKNKINLKFKKPDQTYSDGEYSINFTEGMHKLELRIVDNTIQGFVDGIALNSPQPIYPLSSSEKIATCYISGNPMTKSKSIGVFINENKILAPQEIQHNFSVLNNPPSIKELHATDSTGKTSILKLSSDSTHVEMQTGRTLEEEYTSLLGRFGKEIDSPDGGSVQVDNGISGKVLKMSIKGQTVKNLFDYETHGSDSARIYYNNKNKETNKGCFFYNSLDKTIILSMYEAGTNTWVKNYEVSAKTFKEITDDNLYIKTIIGHFSNGWIASDIDKLENVCNIINLKTSVDTKLPFGLSSAQAIINNNGQSYPIYEPTIQGKTRILDADTGLIPTDPTLPALKDGDVLDLATKTITFANKSTQVLTDEQVKAYSKYKKVISLGGVGGVYDTLEIKDDGSGVYTKRFMRIDDLLIDKWIIASQSDPSVNRWQLESSFYTLYPAKCASLDIASNILSSNMMVATFNLAKTKPNVVYGHTGKIVGVSTEKSISTVEQFKEWFRGQSIVYELDVPIVTHIPKELIPTISTDKTNILHVGGAVKPSSFKVTVPVDKLAEIEARLQVLESTTVDVVLNK